MLGKLSAMELHPQPTAKLLALAVYAFSPGYTLRQASDLITP
jgi:hypothetical protein